MLKNNASTIPPHDVNRTMLDSLTSLRFFAALTVFTWHLRGLVTLPLVNWVQTGYIGVSFFYVLSGFIMAYVYTEKLHDGNSRSIKQFYMSRVAKLWPVHLLTFVLSLPLVFVFGQYIVSSHPDGRLLGAALTNLTLTQAWVPDSGFNFSFNGVAWSLSVEVFFYAVFPAIIYGFGRVRHVLTVKRLVMMMCVLWVITMLIYASIPAAMDDWRFYILPIARLPDFLMGILAGLVFLKIRQGQVTIFKKGRGTRYELAVLIVLAAMLGVSGLLPQSIRFSIWLLPLWACMIFVFAQQSGRISHLLTWRPLVFMGEASFSFYMIHQLVIRYVSLEHWAPIVTVLVSLVAALILSGLIYVIFEEPLRVRLKGFMESKFI